jgi:hypothetical protein
MESKIGNKRLKMIEEFNKTPIAKGEEVYVIPSKFGKYESDHSEKVVVVDIDGDKVTIKRERKLETITISKDLIEGRYLEFLVGVNPFVEKYRSIRSVNYSMESIIHNLELVERRRNEEYVIGGIKTQEVNWNPFVYDKNGKKQYYQRGFVWTLEQKQLLIESVYKGISCGVILVRKRSWGELEKLAAKGETELSFTDIVDGKQRLNAIKQFLNEEITDMYGNYYSDLSKHSQRKFTDHQLFQYAEMEDATDEETLYQFLKMNHEGVPQSKEHLDFVAKLLNN